MKTTSLLSRFFTIALLGLACGFAQPASERPPPVTSRPDPSIVAESNRLEVAPPEAVEGGLRKLAGKPVQGSNGEKLGTIRDFVIDKRTGRVLYAVVSSGGALSPGNQLRLVPIAALHPAPAGADGYIIKIDRVSWERTSPLNREALTDGIVMITEEQQRQLDDAFFTDRPGRNVAGAPPLPPRRDATALPNESGDAQRLAEPAITPTGRTDAPVASVTSPGATLATAARSARHALDNNPGLARANITVTTANGNLRLEGSVATEHQKNQAEAAVKQAASGVKLENQLTIAPE